MLSPYIPSLTNIVSITSENEVNDIKTFELKFKNDSEYQDFDYIPGQFAEISVIGKGECPIGIASSPTEKGTIKFTIKKMGTVTSVMHDCKEGDIIGVRGPLGNGWPVEEMKGKNIVVIGGGFAFSTLRSLITFMLDNKYRPEYRNICVIYGNRNPGEVLYESDLKKWIDRDDIDVVLTIDNEADGWEYEVGYVAPVVKKVLPSPEDAVCVVCGPPIMIKTTVNVLKELNFKDDQILQSLEMRMKCGIGKCGRCNIGNKFVCLDGPVFSLAELKDLPKEY
ncbi:MAG: heterodisulfide reductase subunit F [Candidatus Lokiarchaeota archaeon]|nr:heterodisulfide reductase subunit F [Candidatus Lokiarchaeota archaeon]MBD3337928.1 heterodisulfide reductase subunit F [Candidatus Lokiarchaeota archaeon]